MRLVCYCINLIFSNKNQLGMVKMKIDKFDNIDFKIPKDFNMKFIDSELKLKVYKIRYTYKIIRIGLGEVSVR